MHAYEQLNRLIEFRLWLT